jgi:branched-chain amino acid transport system substrate-binding protein
MKKTRLTLRVTLWVGVLILSLSLSATASGESAYKVGLISSITGYISFGGAPVRDAVVLEVDRVNAGGGIDGRPIELVIEDDASDTTKSVSAFTKLARIHKVDAIIGPILGRSAIIIGKDADKTKIPTLIICPSEPISRKAGYKYTFNIPQNDIIVARAIVDYLKADDYKKIVTIPNITDQLMVAMAESIRSFGEEKNLQVFDAPEGYESGAIDITPQLTKLKPLIKKKGIEAIVVVSHGMNGAVIAKNMKTLGMSTQVVGTHSYGFDFTLQLGGEAMEGTIFPCGKILRAYELPDTDPQKDNLTDFIERFKAKYGRAPGQFASHGWDAVHMLVKAFKTSKGDNQKTRDALENLHNFVGLTGVFNYSPTDHDGLGIDSLVWYKIEDGQFKLMD